MDDHGTTLRGRDLWLAVGIVVLAAVLRWYRLVEWDMWTDEVQTLWTATSGQFKEGPMYRTAPVNFWLTGIAASLFGADELGLRIVPYLAGVATVAVFLWSVARWFGTKVALFGGLLLALSMWHVAWSQTGRHFALQTLLVLLALHFLLVSWIGGRAWGGWVSALVLLAGIFTHSSTVFFLAAFLSFFGVGWLAAMAGEAERRPSVWARGALPYVAVVAIYVPILFLVGRYLVANKQAWNPPYNIIGSLAFYLPPWLLLTALAGVFVLAATRRIHLGVLLALQFIVPAALVTISSGITIASAAYCLASLPALAILFGVAMNWLIERAAHRPVRWAAVAIAAGLYLTATSELAHYYFVYNGLKPRWKDAIAFVADRRAEGEAFFAVEGDVPQYYLGRGEADWYGRAPDHPDVDAWYAVYLSGTVPGSLSQQYRTLLGEAELIQVFPVHYGAKDRSLAIFRRSADEGLENEQP